MWLMSALHSVRSLDLSTYIPSPHPTPALLSWEDIEALLTKQT